MSGQYWLNAIGGSQELPSRRKHGTYGAKQEVVGNYGHYGIWRPYLRTSHEDISEQEQLTLFKNFGRRRAGASADQSWTYQQSVHDYSSPLILTLARIWCVAAHNPVPQDRSDRLLFEYEAIMAARFIERHRRSGSGGAVPPVPTSTGSLYDSLSYPDRYAFEDELSDDSLGKWFQALMSEEAWVAQHCHHNASCGEKKADKLACADDFLNHTFLDLVEGHTGIILTPAQVAELKVGSGHDRP